MYFVSSRNSNTDLKKNKSFPADMLDLAGSYIVTALFGLLTEEPFSEDTYVLLEMQVTQALLWKQALGVSCLVMKQMSCLVVKKTETEFLSSVYGELALSKYYTFSKIWKALVSVRMCFLLLYLTYNFNKENSTQYAIKYATLVEQLMQQTKEYTTQTAGLTAQLQLKDSNKLHPLAHLPQDEFAKATTICSNLSTTNVATSASTNTQF